MDRQSALSCVFFLVRARACVVCREKVRERERDGERGKVCVVGAKFIPHSFLSFKKYVTLAMMHLFNSPVLRKVVFYNLFI